MDDVITFFEFLIGIQGPGFGIAVGVAAAVMAFLEQFPDGIDRKIQILDRKTAKKIAIADIDALLEFIRIDGIRNVHADQRFNDLLAMLVIQDRQLVGTFFIAQDVGDIIDRPVRKIDLRNLRNLRKRLAFDPLRPGNFPFEVGEDIKAKRQFMFFIHLLDVGDRLI